MLYLEYVTHIPGSCRLSNFQPFLLSSIPHKFQPNYDEIFGFECYPTKIIVFKLKNTNYVQCDLYEWNDNLLTFQKLLPFESSFDRLQYHILYFWTQDRHYRHQYAYMNPIH